MSLKHRVWLYTAAVFLLVSMTTPLYQPLENRFYDWCMNWLDIYRSRTLRLHPSIRLIVYSESTRKAFGTWTPERSHELQHALLAGGAQAVVFHPGTHDELLPANGDPERTFAFAAADSWNGQVERDGVCRRLPLAEEVQGKLQPALALRLYARIVGVPEQELKIGPTWVQVGKHTFQTDRQHRVRVRFRESQERRRALDLAGEGAEGVVHDYLAPAPLENVWKDLQAGKLRDADGVYLVGTGFKEARSQLYTPLGKLEDFKVMACLLETLLYDWRVFEVGGILQLAANAVLCLLCLNIFLGRSVLFNSLSWAFIQMTLGVGFSLLLFPLGLYLPYMPFFLITTAMAIGLSAANLVEAQTALARFGGLGALEAGLRGDETVFEEVREKTATIVFTNVLAYLKELERHGSPDVFFERRQAYAQFMADVFRKHKGVVLDYQGDFQMIGFNVELRIDLPDHAARAVAASQEFVTRLSEVTGNWWEVDDEHLGHAHCGICTGPVAVGHVGSERHDGGRIAQAAIGDTSNVAARLLGAAMKKNLPILLAQTTAEAGAGMFQVEALEPIALKGKTHPVPICRPL